MVAGDGEDEVVTDDSKVKWWLVVVSVKLWMVIVDCFYGVLEYQFNDINVVCSCYI